VKAKTIAVVVLLAFVIASFVFLAAKELNGDAGRRPGRACSCGNDDPMDPDTVVSSLTN
jgi:hypothetical protein